MDTKHGSVLIASDAVPLYECIQELEKGEYGISSICADLEAFCHTFDRIRQLQTKGVRIMASHDFQTLSIEELFGDSIQFSYGNQ